MVNKPKRKGSTSAIPREMPVQTTAEYQGTLTRLAKMGASYEESAALASTWGNGHKPDVLFQFPHSGLIKKCL